MSAEQFRDIVGGHDGSERDCVAEAVLCCFAQAKDMNGLLLSTTAVPVPLAIQMARAVADNMAKYGYCIVRAP